MDRLVALAVHRRYLMVALFVVVMRRRPDRLQAAQHRGLSRSDAADGRHRDASPGPLVRGDRALHHHPDRDPGRRHQEPAHHPHHLAVRPVRRQAAVLVRLHLRRGAAAGAEPAVADCRRCRATCSRHLAAQRHRRDLPLPAGRAAELQRARPQDAAGLGAAAPLPRGAGRDRRHRLGRQDQDLRAAGRFQQADRLRPDAAAAAAGGQQLQHQCRRQHRQHRRAVRRGARRRPDPLDRRPRLAPWCRKAAATRCWSRTSPPSRSARSRGSASPASTRATTSSRASC